MNDMDQRTKKELNTVSILSLEEYNRSLTVRFIKNNKVNSERNDYEIQLNDTSWKKIKANSIQDKKVSEDISEQKLFAYRSAIYNTGLKSQQYGIVTEATAPEPGKVKLDCNQEFTLNMLTKKPFRLRSGNIDYAAILIKSEEGGKVGLYQTEYRKNVERVTLNSWIDNSTKSVHANICLNGESILDSSITIAYMPDNPEGLKVYKNSKLLASSSTIALDKAGESDTLNYSGMEDIFDLIETDSHTIEDVHFYQKAYTGEEIQKKIDTTVVSAFVITGLQNGKEYGVRIRPIYGRKKGTPSKTFYGIPFDKSKQILVEDYRDRAYGNETEMINLALSDGQKQKKQVVFAGREYFYTGWFHLNSGDYNLLGVPQKTMITSGSQNFNFTSNGYTQIYGIIFNGNRQRARACRIRNSIGMFRFEKCQFKGGWQTDTSGLAASLSIEDKPEYVELFDCIISDSNSAKPSGIRSGKRATCRGLYITTTSGKIVMKKGEITSIGNLIEDRNGNNIWESGNHGGGLGLFDADSLVIQPGSDSRDREIYLDGVTFSDTPKRFIKANDHTGKIYIENCLFHIREKKTCNQPIIFQGDHPDYDKNKPWYNGYLKNSVFRYDRGEDFILRGSIPGIVQFENNGIEDRFLAEGNRLEVLNNSKAPAGNESMFSVRTNGPGSLQGIQIIDNHAEVPGGFSRFLILRPDAVSNPSEVHLSGIRDMLVKGNNIGLLVNIPLRLGSPRNMDCGQCRIYTYYNLKFENNRYLSAPGHGVFTESDIDTGPWCNECGTQNKEDQYIVDMIVK